MECCHFTAMCTKNGVRGHGEGIKHGEKRKGHLKSTDESELRAVGKSEGKGRVNQKKET